MRPAHVVVYGLVFCEVHGEEAKLGAISEDIYEAEVFIARLCSPHVPCLSSTTRRALNVAVDHLYEQGPNALDKDYEQALLAAYSDSPQALREMVDRWIEEEEFGKLTVF